MPSPPSSFLFSTVSSFVVFFLCVCFLCGSVCAVWPCPSPPAPGHVAVTPEEAFHPHPEFQAEWYYLVGSLCETHGGEHHDGWWPHHECTKKVAFEVTTVLQNATLANGSSVIESYTIFSLTYGVQHYTATVVGLPRRPNPLQPADLVFTTDPPLYTLSYTVLSGTAGQPGSLYNLVAVTPNMTLNLFLRSQSPLMLHGNGGYVDHNSQPPPACNTFDYVSMPHMETVGTVRLNDDIQFVSGSTWWDHEWGVNGKSSSAGGGGWIWIGLHIDSVSIMLQIARNNFQFVYAHSAVEAQHADGTMSYGVIKSIEILSNWTSPTSHFIYPVSLRITTTLREATVFRLDPYFLNQEVRSILGLGAGTPVQFPIWEGDVKARILEGILCNSQGSGWLELVGFAKFG